jgi:subtilisin-like proprotein convertase family protein
MVCAPSSGNGLAITTTDLRGRVGTSIGDCTSTFGGTSSAAPLVAGVVALMLSANPALTYRDVMHVLVRTSSMVSPTDASWAYNGARFHHSHKFGFGLVNSSAAVALARTWHTVAPLETHSSGLILVRQDVPEQSTVPTRSQTIITAELQVEYAEVVFNATARRRGDVNVQLVSPFGVVSQLVEEHDDGNQNYDGWKLTSCRHWGENSRGAWELRVRDTRASNPVHFVSWELILYGTSIPKK